MNGKGIVIMPEITRFYGIVIKMYFKPKEHEPSHIHALYGEYMGVLLQGKYFAPPYGRKARQNHYWSIRKPRDRLFVTS
jgi:hypothetical protein